MKGVGEVLSVRLIAEIGDVRRFHNGSALVAFAGIDAHLMNQVSSSELNVISQSEVLLHFEKSDMKSCTILK